MTDPAHESSETIHEDVPVPTDSRPLEEEDETPTLAGAVTIDEEGTVYEPQVDAEATVLPGSAGYDDVSNVASDTGADDADTMDTGAPPSSRGSGSSRPSSGSRRSSRGHLKSSAHAGPQTGRLATGEVFAGKYELLGEIARGGMGVVYRARQIDLNRVVALKVMLAGSHASESERRRFILEAEASARLKHPHIVPVYDIGEVGENLYFTMDYVEGKPLSKRKKDLSREQLRDVMIKVCDGVAYAHQRGIIHRDLKPENVMMTADDEPLIMDFGLAKQVQVTDEDGQPSLVTREGSIMGTPHYMPPEQAEGAISEIDIRSDVYSLGVILYELWTGQLPFSAPSISKLILMILGRDPTPPRQIDASIDPDLEAIVLKAMEKEKDNRYATAAELRADLERQRDGLTISARRATAFYRARKWARRSRLKLAVGGVIAALLAAFLGYVVHARGERERAEQARYAERMGEARRGSESLGAEWTRVRKAVAAFLGDGTASLAARRSAIPSHRKRVAALQARAADLRAGLGEYVARAEARAVDAELKEGARAMRALADRLATLESVHTHLARASQRLRAADALCGRAIAALSSRAVATRVTAPRALNEAVPFYADRLRASRGGGEQDASLFGPTFLRAKADLDQALEAVSQHVFTALSDSLAGSAEQARARNDLGRIAALRGRLERARAGAFGVRLAGAMSEAAGDLLGVMAASASAPVALRFRSARLTQAIVQRGLEGEPDRQSLHALRRRANRAYAEVLLAMQAYPIFEAELNDENAFAPADRKALVAAKERALRGRKALSDALDRRLSGLGKLSVEQLARRIAGLEALAKAPALDRALDARRVQGLREARRSLSERAERDVREALARAQQAEALAPAEQARQLTRLRGLWDAAEATCRLRSRHLARPFLAKSRTGIRLGRALLARNAALGLEPSDPVRALRLAREARALYRQQPRQAGAALTAIRELTGRLTATVARLRRRDQTPEGMVLVPGSAGKVELGGGAANRNPVRRVRVAPFYLSLREVTNAEYQVFVTSAAYRSAAFWKKLGASLAQVRPPLSWQGAAFPKGTGALPVTGITWHEARGYAAFRGKRLPSDAEWEYAARYHRKTARLYPWGDRWRESFLAHALRAPGSNAKDRTPLGVLDMAGSVSEWVVLRDPQGARPAARGASFLYPYERIAAGTYRLLPAPALSYRGPQLGLRLAQGSAR